MEVFVKIPALLEAFLCTKEGALTPLTHNYAFLNNPLKPMLLTTTLKIHERQFC
jgi:hypothetical protein